MRIRRLSEFKSLAQDHTAYQSEGQALKTGLSRPEAWSTSQVFLLQRPPRERPAKVPSKQWTPVGKNNSTPSSPGPLRPSHSLLSAGNCAHYQKGGWWYNACAHSNLNGVWYRGGHYRSRYQDGVYWAEFRGGSYSLKKVVMMIRPNPNTFH